MDRHTAKPGWNLTLWALAGFLLVSLAVYVMDGGTPGETAATSATSQ